MAQVSKFIEKMDEELNGSRDEPGLKVKLDRIQQIVETRTKHVFIIYVTLIGLVVGWVFKWISTLAK
jgi:hypothetical protein